MQHRSTSSSVYSPDVEVVEPHRFATVLGIPRANHGRYLIVEIERTDAHVYVIDSTLIIPTVARAAAGFSVETEPVEVLPNATHDSVTAVLDRARARVGPAVSPNPSARQRPVVLEYAQAASLQRFEQRARLWIVSWTGDRATVTPTRRLPEGGWEDDVEHATTHAGPDATGNVARHILTEAFEGT